MRHLNCTALGRLNVVWISNPKQLQWRRLESESEVQQIVFTPTSCGDFFFFKQGKFEKFTAILSPLIPSSSSWRLFSHTATNVQWWYILLGGLSRKWIMSRIIHSASWCEVKIWHDLLLAQGCERGLACGSLKVSAPTERSWWWRVCELCVYLLLLVRSGPCKLCGTRHQMLNMLVSDWLQTVLMWWLSRNWSDGNELLQKLKQRVHWLANFLLSFQWRNQTVLIVNFWTENLVLS